MNLMVETCCDKLLVWAFALIISPLCLVYQSIFLWEFSWVCCCISFVFLIDEIICVCKNDWCFQVLAFELIVKQSTFSLLNWIHSIMINWINIIQNIQNLLPSIQFLGNNVILLLFILPHHVLIVGLRFKFLNLFKVLISINHVSCSYRFGNVIVRASVDEFVHFNDVANLTSIPIFIITFFIFLW